MFSLRPKRFHPREYVAGVEPRGNPILCRVFVRMQNWTKKSVLEVFTEILNASLFFFFSDFGFLTQEHQFPV